MENEFKSFYKEVKGNEGDKCHINTRLDTYGRGCQHNCNYCYAKSLLDFRKLWDYEHPAVADINKIRRKIKRIKDVDVIRLGGMTDCFQELEKTERVTYETIKALNEVGQEYLIVTKSDLVASPEYLEVLDPQLAHIQVTLTCTSDDLYEKMDYENAPLPSERIRAIETLQRNGFDVSVRLSPFIDSFVDYDVLADIQCDKILVEFLRVNTWVKRWFGYHIDLSQYTVKQSNYWHLPLSKKQELIRNINGFKEITICEDESEAYEYWKHHFNPNPEDCCNLRKNRIKNQFQI